MKMKDMLALRAHAPAPAASRPLRADRVPVPEPAPGEVRVRVLACAVCRTDLHVVEGDLPFPARPIVPGHQIVGEVEAVGAGATLRPGERVGIAWLRWTCGACAFCASGRENLCAGARFTGYHDDGGFAERAVAPAAFVYPIPPEYADPAEAAPLLCAGIIGYRALRRSGIAPGGRLALYGFGSSAHVALQIARRRWGCEVFVVTRGAGRRALARALGAAWTGAPGDPLPAPADAAIVFAPAGDVVPLALEGLARGGTCAIAGIHMTPIPALDYERHLFYERSLASVTANTREDGRALLAEAAAAGVRPEVVRFPLAEANEALARLASGDVDGTAVLVP